MVKSFLKSLIILVLSFADAQALIIGIDILYNEKTDQTILLLSDRHLQKPSPNKTMSQITDLEKVIKNYNGYAILEWMKPEILNQCEKEGLWNRPAIGETDGMQRASIEFEKNHVPHCVIDYRSNYPILSEIGELLFSGRREKELYNRYWACLQGSLKEMEPILQEIKKYVHKENNSFASHINKKLEEIDKIRQEICKELDKNNSIIANKEKNEKAFYGFINTINTEYNLFKGGLVGKIDVIANQLFDLYVLYNIAKCSEKKFLIVWAGYFHTEQILQSLQNEDIGFKSKYEHKEIENAKDIHLLHQLEELQEEAAAYDECAIDIANDIKACMTCYGIESLDFLIGKDKGKEEEKKQKERDKKNLAKHKKTLKELETQMAALIAGNKQEQKRLKR